MYWLISIIFAIIVLAVAVILFFAGLFVATVLIVPIIVIALFCTGHVLGGLIVLLIYILIIRHSNR